MTLANDNRANSLKKRTWQMTEKKMTLWHTTAETMTTLSVEIIKDNSFVAN